VELAEKLLLLMTKKPPAADCQPGTDDHSNLQSALSILCRVYPGFMRSIVGKRILDFGCGEGWQALALARGGAANVVGIDRNPTYVRNAQKLAHKYQLSDRVTFTDSPSTFKSGFDMVISQNSMEHFSEPAKALEEMISALDAGGSLLITFGPPWFAPYGSHMEFMTAIPWINIWFDERVVMRARARFKSDGATRYEEVEGGLNKMTVGRFEQLIARCGLDVRYKKLECVKGMDFLASVPLMRELFTNHVSFILMK
jgi:SAM-dependent methyltransferase